MNRIEDTTIEAVLEHLIADGAGGIGPAFTRMFELAMRLERERYLGAGHYERSGDRRGYANGYKPKRLDTPGGTLMVQVPKTAGHEDEPFYPQSLERGQRSVRAVMLAVAEMYIKGVSTREVEAILRQFGIEGTVRNFVCGRAVEHYAAMALMKRSPNRTANWALAMDHSRGGILHSFSDRFKIR